MSRRKKGSLRGLFKRRSKKRDSDDQEGLDASLMRVDRQKSANSVQFDTEQTEMLHKVYNYHSVDPDRLRKRFKRTNQLEAFIRKSHSHIDAARTANVVILGTTGSGKTKVWWNFLNYFTNTYKQSNTWCLSPKDFYHILTEKIMNISVDILMEYNHHRASIGKPASEVSVAPTTCLAPNSLARQHIYTLELSNKDVKQGFDFFQDIISKISKILETINDNIQLEEQRQSSQNAAPNWDKIQDLRNIEKELKQFQPGHAVYISKLWQSQQLRELFLNAYGLHNARNLFYFIDHIHTFVAQQQHSMHRKQNAEDDLGAFQSLQQTSFSVSSPKSPASPKSPRKKSKLKRHRSVQPQPSYAHTMTPKASWQWEWSFEELLRCQIRTTGVIEHTCNLPAPAMRSSNEHHSLSEQVQKQFGLKLKLWDVGGAQNERKKWRHVLNTNPDTAKVDCVVYVVNLMGFYRKSWESNTNDLAQSLQLFTCLVSQDDSSHFEKCHDDEKNNESAYGGGCVDVQLRRAMTDVSLVYIVFSDTQGLKMMLEEKGYQFSTCFDDYQGDNSVLDVQHFVELKFRRVVDEVNSKVEVDVAGDSGEDELPGVNIVRTASVQTRGIGKRASAFGVGGKRRSTSGMNGMPSGLGRIRSLPGLMQRNESVSSKLKRLKCRFVSVIDHEAMKSVMNEIVESSFLNKIELDNVVHSLL